MNVQRYHPFARLFFCALGLVVASLVMGVMLYVGSALATAWTGRPPGEQLKEVVENFAIPLLMFSYPAQVLWISYCRTHLDGFSFPSLGLRKSRAVPNLLRGAVTGALAIGLLMAVLWLCGLVSVTGWSNDVLDGGSSHAVLALVGYALAFLAVGFFEELLFRGYALHNFNSWLGWHWALFWQGLVFALVHLLNVVNEPVAAQAAALGAFPSLILIAVFFGISYRKTGSLWFPIGFHFAWNFFLGNVFSLPVSGIQTFQLLSVDINQSSWLTGGTFGAEGSLLLIPILLALIYFISLAPDHPQALVDLQLLSQEEYPAPLPAYAPQPVAMEEEENRENRFRTKFGTSQGFSAETLKELRDLQEERERNKREAEEARKREAWAVTEVAAAPPVALEAVVEPVVVPDVPEAPVAPVEAPAAPEPVVAPVPEVAAPRPVAAPVAPSTPVVPVAPSTPPSPVSPAAPASPSADVPVKKKPPAPRW